MRRCAAEKRAGGSRDFSEPEESKDGRPLTPPGLLAMRNRFGTVAGVRFHPHRFRHTFAVAYPRAGCDVFTLQERPRQAAPAMSEHDAAHLTGDLKRGHDGHSADHLDLGHAQRRLGADGGPQAAARPAPDESWRCSV